MKIQTPAILHYKHTFCFNINQDQINRHLCRKLRTYSEVLPSSMTRLILSSIWPLFTAWSTIPCTWASVKVPTSRPLISSSSSQACTSCTSAALPVRKTQLVSKHDFLLFFNEQNGESLVSFSNVYGFYH